MHPSTGQTRAMRRKIRCRKRRQLRQAARLHGDLSHECRTSFGPLENHFQRESIFARGIASNSSREFHTLKYWTALEQVLDLRRALSKTRNGNRTILVSIAGQKRGTRQDACQLDKSLQHIVVTLKLGGQRSISLGEPVQ